MCILIGYYHSVNAHSAHIILNLTHWTRSFSTHLFGFVIFILAAITLTASED